MTIKHTQGVPFQGDYHWRNSQTGDFPTSGGEFEGHLEQRYEAFGDTMVWDGVCYWARFPVAAPKETT